MNLEYMLLIQSMATIDVKYLTRGTPSDRASAARSAAKILGRNAPTDRPALTVASTREPSRGHPTDRPYWELPTPLVR